MPEPNVTLTSPFGYTYNYFGRTLAGAGDVDGDGYGDLVVVSDGGPSAVFLFLGGPHGPRAGSAETSAPPAVPDARFALGRRTWSIARFVRGEK